MPKPPGAKTKASGRSDIRDLYVFKGPAPATMSPESGHVRRKTSCPLCLQSRPWKRIPAQGHVRFTPESRHVRCS